MRAPCFLLWWTAKAAWLTAAYPHSSHWTPSWVCGPGSSHVAPNSVMVCCWKAECLRKSQSVLTLLLWLSWAARICFLRLRTLLANSYHASMTSKRSSCSGSTSHPTCSFHQMQLLCKAASHDCSLAFSWLARMAANMRWSCAPTIWTKSLNLATCRSSIGISLSACSASS